MEPNDPVKVYDAWNSLQAHFVRNLLAESGIRARVASNAIQGVSGRVPYQKATSPVLVAARDIDLARSIVSTYESGLPGSRQQETEPVEPYCYHCGQAVESGQSPCPSCNCDLNWRD